MDACEIASILAKELFMYQLSSFDGFNSGVGAPTRTTATLTPTTLRNIEQTLFDYYPDDSNNSAPFQAGFVPPLAPTFQTTVVVDPEYSMDSSSMSSSSWHTTPPPPPITTEEVVIESAKHSISNISSNYNNNNKTPSRRNMGGRRPNKTNHLSPEEEEKRRVRRERNKLAAARCRRRREDHTSELLTEVEQLESKKKELQLELQELQRNKEELEYLFQVHKPICKRQIRDTTDIKTTIATTVVSINDKIKTEPIDAYDIEEEPSPKRILLSSAVYNIIPSTISTGMLQPITTTVQTTTTSARPNRPNTLNVPVLIQPSQALNTITINTPSNGTFNFDSLMEGGTGLTPINYPLKALTETTNSADLITPTSDASKLCSL